MNSESYGDRYIVTSPRGMVSIMRLMLAEVNIYRELGYKVEKEDEHGNVQVRPEADLTDRRPE